MFAKLKKFFAEVKSEFKKVTWPNKRELVGSTMVVLFILLIMGIYLGFLDMVFSNLTKWLLTILGIG
ncbi:MAG: preprotein translocase subunit SecE [Thermotogae bacterium]|nr:preprotein translocase subunit SecE [Thermotogota bacterium]